MKLSVVVPFHNVEAYAAQTLRSLRSSAGPDIEFVLVNDGSTDGTSEIIDSCADELPGARLIELASNRGVAAARNVGIDASHGEHLAFLDGDDFVAPGYYPALVATIERLGCEMVRTDHVRVQGLKRTVHGISHGRRGVVQCPRNAILPVHHSTSVDMPNAWAGVYHRRLADAGLLHFPEHLRTCEDRLWNWRLHLHVSTFAIVGMHGVFYRRGVFSSLTQISDIRQLDFLPAFDQIVAEVTADRDAARLLPKAIRSYCSLICFHLERSDSYPPNLAAELVRRCARALRELPQIELDAVVAHLDAQRASRINCLRGTP